MRKNHSIVQTRCPTCGAIAEIPIQLRVCGRGMPPPGRYADKDCMACNFRRQSPKGLEFLKSLYRNWWLSARSPDTSLPPELQ